MARGLGVLRGPVTRLRAGRVPHMGWNTLRVTAPSALLDGLDGADVYFAHSFACEPADGVVVAEVEHEGRGRRRRRARRRRGRPVPSRAQRLARRARPRERGRVVKKRVIPCLDVAGGRVVKGVRFEGLREVGDPVELATRYSALGADELVFLDVTASIEGRRPMLALVEQAAAELEIPFTVGGGIASLEDARGLLRAGADKVAVNKAAVDRPQLLTALADEFGAQAVVCAIDSRAGEVVTDGGRSPARPGRGAVGERGGRPRRRRDPAHLDRRRRDPQRLRPRAHLVGRACRHRSGDRLRRRGRRLSTWPRRSRPAPRRRSSRRSSTSAPSGCRS